MTSFLLEQTAIQEVFGNEVSYHPLTQVVTVIHPGPCHPGIFDSQIRFISEESTHYRSKRSSGAARAAR